MDSLGDSCREMLATLTTILFGSDAPSTLDIIWLVLSDEQMSKSWLFCSLNDEQMSNWAGVKHLPAIGSAKGCQYMMFDVLSEE